MKEGTIGWLFRCSPFCFCYVSFFFPGRFLRHSQVALKTNIDIFYFGVNADLFVVLELNEMNDKEAFRQKWQAVGDARQVIVCVCV